MREIAGVKLYTVKETATMLGVTAQTIRKYVKQGKLKGKRVGRPIMISEPSIRFFLTGGLVVEREPNLEPVKSPLDAT